MYKLTSRGFAIAAGIAAMLPCYDIMCCLGLPVGIWVLVVLFRPGVVQLFQRGSVTDVPPSY